MWVKFPYHLLIQNSERCVKACCQLDGLVRGSLMNLPPQFASGDLSLSGLFFSVVVVVVAAGNCLPEWWEFWIPIWGMGNAMK